jgi:hypothetical protein
MPSVLTTHQGADGIKKDLVQTKCFIGLVTEGKFEYETNKGKKSAPPPITAGTRANFKLSKQRT